MSMPDPRAGDRAADHAADRPNWSALTGMFDDLKRTWSEVPKLQQQMLAVTGEARSEDRLVRVVVGPRGQLVELEIDPRVYRKPDSRALAATIVATARLAAEDAARQSKEILDRSLPSDLRMAGAGITDLDRLAFRHDADVVRDERPDKGG